MLAYRNANKNADPYATQTNTTSKISKIRRKHVFINTLSPFCLVQKVIIDDKICLVTPGFMGRGINVHTCTHAKTNMM